MSSVTDICNDAIGHLGSDAQVSNIDPPDGSVEAGYCKRFWPKARRELLEHYTWTFALKRATLTPLSTNPSARWAYAYQIPPDCLRPVRIPTAMSGVNIFTAPASYPATVGLANDDKGAEYAIEGTTLYTNEPEATLIYGTDVTDPNRYSPTFEAAAGYLLGSYLAGPIVRGDAGVKMAEGLRKIAGGMASAAANLNAKGGARPASHTPSSLAARA